MLLYFKISMTGRYADNHNSVGVRVELRAAFRNPLNSEFKASQPSTLLMASTIWR
ncbi:MAG: hypothetical protein QM800_01835 [Paludibacter sp.]